MNNSFNRIWLMIALLINGASIMLLEILGTRIIAPFFGTTLYVWTALIVVTLFALALGYYLGGRFADKKPDWKIFYLLFFFASILFLIIPLIDNVVMKASSNLGIMWGPLLAAFLLFTLPLGILGMITPFAIRLSTKEVESVGRTVGNFYAISTTGSIVGALLVAYLLIPNIAMNIILVSVAIVLFAVSLVWLIIKKATSKKIFALLVIIIVLSILSFSQKTVSASIDSVNSFYGEVKVEILSSDLTCIVVNNIPQSCFNPDLDGSAYPYTKLMVRGLEHINNPQNVLVIGDGGGLITREIIRDSNVMVDAVDIDKKIFELGKQYLFFNDSPQVNKIVADGRNFVRESDKEYDSIMLDAFTDSTPAGHLFTQEFFELAKNKMTDDGVLVMNTFGFNKGEGREALQIIYNTLDSVFDDVYISPAGNANQEEREFYNFIMYASDKEMDRMGRIYKLELAENTPIITDNYNPLEYYSLSSSEELIKLYILENGK